MFIGPRVMISFPMSAKENCAGMRSWTIKLQFTIVLSILVLWLAIQPNAFAQSKPESLFTNDALKKYESVKVAKVISADRLVLETGEEIHLIGIDSPDVPRKKGNLPSDQFGFPIIPKEIPVTPGEEQAYDFVRDLLEGKKVRLEFDVQKISNDFKTLAYVFLSDDVFVNAEILRNGFANLQIIPPNLKYANDLRKAYQEARKEKRGLQSDF